MKLKSLLYSKTRSQGHLRTPSQHSASERNIIQVGVSHHNNYIVLAVEKNIPGLLVVSGMSNAENVVNWAMLPKYVGHLQQQ